MYHMTEFYKEQAFNDATVCASDRASGDLQSLYIAQFDAAAKAIDIAGHDVGSQTIDMATQEPIASTGTQLNQPLTLDTMKPC